MPCFSPMHADIYERGDGKNLVRFTSRAARRFHQSGAKSSELGLDFVQCGQCVGCRLTKTCIWAGRIMDESRLYSDNSFITLTVNKESMDYVFPGLSLRKEPFTQDFMRKLRYGLKIGLEWIDDKGDKQVYQRDFARYYYAGEYGDNQDISLYGVSKLGRPHLHAALFNVDFPDKEYWKSVNGVAYYTSPLLAKLWPYGFNVVGELNHQSAAYIARYVTKKMYGDVAEDHYQRFYEATGELVSVMPEFSGMSTTGGIGKGFYMKYAASDMLPRDEWDINGHQAAIPRYYMKLLEKSDPSKFLQIKEARRKKRVDRGDEFTYRSLSDAQNLQIRRMKMLVRHMEDVH